jgi:hypothetical protein
MSNRRTKGQARLWAGGISMAAAAAAMIGMGTAHADTADDLLGQAGADLTQATQVLDSVPATALDAKEASLVDAIVGIQTVTDQQAIPEAETYLNDLPVADQTNPLLLDANQQLVQASQELLTADQGFLSAVDAGDLNTLSGAFAAELPLVADGLGEVGASVDALFTDAFAGLDPSILTAF